MNTQALTDTPLETQATAVIPASRRLFWSVKRELWEYRSLYLGASRRRRVVSGRVPVQRDSSATQYAGCIRA